MHESRPLGGWVGGWVGLEVAFCTCFVLVPAKLLGSLTYTCFTPRALCNVTDRVVFVVYCKLKPSNKKTQFALRERVILTVFHLISRVLCVPQDLACFHEI